MKIFRVNDKESLLIYGCDAPISRDDGRGCPAFASCCEYGDICQIEGIDCYPLDRPHGFPLWCPLDDDGGRL